MKRAHTEDRSPAGSFQRAYALFGEQLRFVVVGVINTAVGYLLFLAVLAAFSGPLRSLGTSQSGFLRAVGEHYYLVLQWAAWVLMVPVSTLMMRRFVFRSRGSRVHQVGRGYVIYLPAQGLSSLILWLAVGILHLVPQVGQLIAIVVTTILSYLGHKYFTFRVPLEVGEVPAEEMLS